MKESVIQSSIEQLLRYYENMGRLVYQKNNSGAYKTNHGSFVRFGKAGSPDFYIFLPDGKLMCLEVKNEKGKLNANQERFRQAVEKLGHRYEITRSVDETEEILWGEKRNR